MSYKNCGLSWDREQLRAYLKTLAAPDWSKGVTFHHTAYPNLKMRPSGWTAGLMANVRDGYINDRGWNRGPHFYPDDREIWGLTPPTVKGIHAVAYNSTHIGIEVLGDYDKGGDDPNNGRGAAAWKNGFICAAEVLKWLGIKDVNKSSITLHRNDPKTSKTCPGNNISHDWIISGVKAEMSGTSNDTLKQPVGERIAISKWLELNGKNLKIQKAEDQVLVGGIWIESAKYDKVNETTTALVSELEKDLAGL